MSIARARLCAALILSLSLLALPAQARTFPYSMESETLPNGLRVVFVPMDSPGLFAYFTLVRVGSRNEVEAGKTGFAHFFEHMMFRGTERFPEEAQRKLVADLGLDSNAFTWDDETVYYYAGPNTAIDKVIELEADRFQHLKYSKEQFRTEAKAVLGEYNKNDSDPGQRIEEKLLENAFTKHTYRHTTIGFKADIIRMPEQYDYSLSFFKQFYRPDACTIFVIGDFNRASVASLIKKEYGGWTGKVENPKILVEPPQTKEKRVAIEWPNDTKPRLTVGWHGPAAGKKESAVMQVIGPLLFGTASPLYEDLVLKRHLAEAFEVSYMGGDPRLGHRDPRLFNYTAILKKPEDISVVNSAVEDAIGELRNGKIDAARVEDVKQHLRYALLGNLETPSEVGELLSLAVAPTGDLGAVDAQFDLLASITVEDVAAFAKKYLVQANRTVITTVAGAKGGGK